jgi:hypothetical protein
LKIITQENGSSGSLLETGAEKDKLMEYYASVAETLEPRTY